MAPIKLLVAACALALGACGGIEIEPLDYTPIDELQPGPGLFTGEDGVWTVYSSTDDD